MIKVRKVIWEKVSNIWPADEGFVKTHSHRAVYDGYNLHFEMSTHNDAMGNPVWESVTKGVPTEFVKDFAKILYNK